jgi:hypothetical protein
MDVMQVDVLCLERGRLLPASLTKFKLEAVKRLKDE